MAPPRPEMFVLALALIVSFLVGSALGDFHMPEDDDTVQYEFDWDDDEQGGPRYATQIDKIDSNGEVQTEYVFSDGTTEPHPPATQLRKSSAKPSFKLLNKQELRSAMMEATAAAAKAAGTPQYRWPRPKCIDWLSGEELRKHCQFQSIDSIGDRDDVVGLQHQLVCPELCAEAGFGFDGQQDDADDDGLYHGRNNKVEL
jgi:hypothetical protein